MKFREKKRKHDDAHIPMGGRGNRGTMPKNKTVKPSIAFIEKFYTGETKDRLLNEHYPPFDYDPDFRSKVHPKDPLKPFCCRCQKNVDVSKAIAVSVNDESHKAIEGHDRHEEIRTNFHAHQRGLVYNGYIGKDCMRALRAFKGE